MQALYDRFLGEKHHFEKRLEPVYYRSKLCLVAIIKRERFWKKVRFMLKFLSKFFSELITRECWQVLLSYLVYSFLDIWAFKSTITIMVYPPYLRVIVPQTLPGRLGEKYYSGRPASPIEMV